MKLLLIAPLVSLLLGACSTSSNLSHRQEVAFHFEEGAQAKPVFDMINQKRQLSGFDPLVANSVLNGLAQSHARFLMQNRARYEANPRLVGEASNSERAMLAHRKVGLKTMAESHGMASSIDDLEGLWANLNSDEFTALPLKEKYEICGVGTAIDSDGSVFVSVILADVAIRKPTAHDLRPW